MIPIDSTESTADQNSSQTENIDNNVSTVDSIESSNTTTGLPGLRYTVKHTKSHIMSSLHSVLLHGILIKILYLFQ